MSIGALIFMVTTWSFIIWLTIFSFSRFLSNKKQ